jgi:hypothetical protein
MDRLRAGRRLDRLHSTACHRLAPRSADGAMAAAKVALGAGAALVGGLASLPLSD